MTDLLIKRGLIADAAPELNDNRMSARFCIASEREDRDGDVIKVAGIDLTDHRKNPVVLLNHDQSLLIGKSEGPDGVYAVEMRPEVGKVFATCYYQQDNQLGVQTYALAYRTGEPWNETGFSNPEFDSLLEEAYAISDADERRKLMEKMEKIIQDSGILVQPYWRSTFRHVTANVHGLAMHQTFEIHLEATWIEEG